MGEDLTGKGEGEKGSGGDSSPLHPFTLSPLLGRLWLLLPVLAAIWLYGRALGLAYFNDDPTGHFAWMEGQTLFQFFAGSADYGYYRPVVFAVLRLTELLFGNAVFPHNPVADHTLLVLLHGTNAAMVWALARRLSGSGAFATTAALVFVFVPFSYEAVAYVASLTHPLVVFWTLLTLLLYERGQKNYELRTTNYELRIKNRPLTTDHWSLVTGYWALIPLILGLLTHENGLFIFPALVGLDWARRPGAAWRERARRLWPFAIPPALFIILWLLIPKNSEQGLNGLADIGRNVVPFLQTLVYPLLPVIRLDAAGVWPLALLAAAVVALLGLLAWRLGAWRLWAFALGWFALASLPALIFLGPAYVYGSPRLSYLPSVGAALLWALPALWLMKRRRTTDNGLQDAPRVMIPSAPDLLLAVLIAAYVLALLLPPLPFIRCQLDFYDETSRFARGMAAAAAGAPAGRDVVFINAPFFFSSTAARPDGCPSPYPWMPVGGILIPPYAQPRDFVRFNGGPDRPVTGVTYPGYAPGWRTFGPEIDDAALRNYAANDAAFVFDLVAGSFADLSAAWQPDAGPVASPLAAFGEALALAAAQMVEEPDRLVARLEWRVAGPTAGPLAAFVHVYDAAGALVAQSDGPPGGGLAPRDLWRPGDGLADERVLDLSALPPGAYTVAVGVYDAVSGARLPAEADGVALADDVFPIGVIER